MVGGGAGSTASVINIRSALLDVLFREVERMPSLRYLGTIAVYSFSFFPLGIFSGLLISTAIKFAASVFLLLIPRHFINESEWNRKI